MSSCSVSSNRCAIRPANAGGNVLKGSCNASASGAAALSPRMADSSIGSGTCTIKRSCNASEAARRDAGRGCNPDGQRATPAHEQRVPGSGSSQRCLGGPAKRLDWRPCSRADMRWPSSSVAACDCDDQTRKTARSTNTCAVQIAPSLLPDWVEQDGPVGHAHARRRSLKKTHRRLSSGLPPATPCTSRPANAIQRGDQATRVTGLAKTGMRNSGRQRSGTRLWICGRCASRTGRLAVDNATR